MRADHCPSQELEKEIGEELPLELPQEGGTTATALVLYPTGLIVAWVGDSRAVMAVDAEPESAGLGGSGGPARLSAVALTTDHNTSDSAEKARLEGAGGKAGGEGMHGHVSVGGAEGSLKVTRSLGDSPFHKGEAVSAVPGVAHVPLTAAIRFVVVASDGIWDHLSNAEVVDIAAEAIRKARTIGQPGNVEPQDGAPAPPGLSKQRSNGPMLSVAAAAACEAVLDRIDRGQASGELDSNKDDRSICVAILRPG